MKQKKKESPATGDMPQAPPESNPTSTQSDVATAEPQQQSAPPEPEQELPGQANTEEQQETPAPEEPPTPTADEIAALVAEAEQRGYLRGRNEQIEELMRIPPMMAPLHDARPDDPPIPEEPDFQFLSRQRVSIWDK